MLKKSNQKPRVIMAMSGGVDSSVAAALLKEKGYEVYGVHLRLFKNAYSRINEQSARTVADILGIKFKAITAEKEFKKAVIEHFLGEYGKGRTPNPCVVCNPKIKFKILLGYAAEMKADFVATGHYAFARKIKVKKSKLKIKEKTIYGLSEAKDKNKDQSYFLYRLKQGQLARILFPLGGYLKTEVRKMAKKFKLPVYEKKESQDVCFLAGSSVGKFIAKNLKMKPGDIISDTGEIIGRHAGLPLYTLGQRKGINIGGTGPYYVIGKDSRKNCLIVTNNPKNPALFSDKAEIYDTNWILEPPKAKKVLVRTRYRNPLVYAKIETRKKRGEVRFNEPQRAVAPGQSIVFYAKSGEVIGGGIIK